MCKWDDSPQKGWMYQWNSDLMVMYNKNANILTSEMLKRLAIAYFLNA